MATEEGKKKIANKNWKFRCKINRHVSYYNKFTIFKNKIETCIMCTYLSTYLPSRHDEFTVGYSITNWLSIKTSHLEN